MRLYGSLQNRMMERQSTGPAVGMPCTELYYSDRVGTSVAEIRRNGKLIVTANGHRYTLRNDGRWVAVGGKYTCLALGFSETYQDPSF